MFKSKKGFGLILGLVLIVLFFLTFVLIVPIAEPFTAATIADPETDGLTRFIFRFYPFALLLSGIVSIIFGGNN